MGLRLTVYLTIFLCWCVDVVGALGGGCPEVSRIITIHIVESEIKGQHQHLNA